MGTSSAQVAESIDPNSASTTQPDLATMQAERELSAVPEPDSKVVPSMCEQDAQVVSSQPDPLGELSDCEAEDDSEKPAASVEVEQETLFFKHDVV